MKGKPTPGPWRAEIGLRGDVIRISADADIDNGTYVTQTVAEINGYASSPTNRANGSLIAAAPDLYETLELALQLRAYVVEYLTSGYADQPSARSAEREADAIEEEIRAAIKRAKGEQP